MNLSRKLFLLVNAVAMMFIIDGCASKSTVRLREQNAYLAGQNAALQQQQVQAQAGVTVVGSVQNSHVAWVAGLTLSQAIATANYVGAEDPKHIVITRNGESAALDASVLLDGTSIPLEVGDVVELH